MTWIPRLIGGILLLAISMEGALARTTSWLDRPARGWNRPGASVPAAPRLADPPDPTNGRPPGNAAERALARKGWILMGPATHVGRLAVVRASASGGDLHFMLSYQLFAFYDGRFVGTLAPAPMTSSTDGALGGVFEVKGKTLKAAFARYMPKDPLCCPSRESDVTYRLEGGAGRMLLVPVRTSTKPTQ